MIKIKDNQPKLKIRMHCEERSSFLSSNRGRKLYSIVWTQSLVFLIVLMSFCSEMYGQIPSIISEFEGSTGIVIPRMSTNEILKISDPADGLLIYDSTLSQFKYFSITAGTWRSISVEEQVTRSSRTSENLGIPHNPSSSAEWNVQGNIGADLYSSDPPLLGPTDEFPIVFITNDHERMRIDQTGDIAIVRSLAIGENLLIKQNVNLNSAGGQSINNGPFTVTSQSAATLSGSLTSQQNVDFNSGGGQTINDGPFTVTAESPTLLTGELTVDKKTLMKLGSEVYGSTTLHGLFEVDHQYPSLFTGLVTVSDLAQSPSGSVSSGALVTNGGWGIGKNLNVGGDFDIAGTSAFAGPVSFTSPVSITAQEQSTSLNSGALVVAGGSGIAKRLNVGGAATFENSLQVAGATLLQSTLGVAGATTLGSTLGVTGASSLAGTLGVTGATSMMSTLNVLGVTSLMSTLGVTGSSTLSSSLNTAGATSLGSTLGVTGATSLMSTLVVSGSTFMSSTLNVTGATLLGNNLAVTGATSLQSTLHVSGNLSININKFSVTAANGNTTVDGSLMINKTMTLNDRLNVNASGPYIANFANSMDRNGLNIKIAGTSDNANNYVTFINGGGATIGRIEGQTVAELPNDPIYNLYKSQYDISALLALINYETAVFELAQATAELAATSASSTACGGLGACLTVPVPSYIAVAVANVAFRAANLALKFGFLIVTGDKRDNYVKQRKNRIGVTYQSGAGDYAEWLPKADHLEEFMPGFIVGMKNGRISLNTTDADKILAISTNPFVLGNMPERGDESKYEKVAFMGQVPVHVTGNVNTGDYILPSGNNDGLAKAVRPEKMTAKDYSKIVGMAWSRSTNDAYNLINVAVGLNDSDVSKLVTLQSKEIEELHKKIEQLRIEENNTDAVLAQLIPEYKDALRVSGGALTKASTVKKINEKQSRRNEMVEIISADPSTIVYFEITPDQIREGINLAETMFQEAGGDIRTHPFWNRMTSDSGFKENFVIEMSKKFKNTVHTHKMIDKNHDNGH